MAILWFRIRYGMSPFYLAIFSIDGKWPDHPGEYVQHQSDKVETLMRRMNPVDRYVAVDDKIAFYRRCKARSLPTPEILCVIPAAGERSSDGFAPVPVSNTGKELQQQLDNAQVSEFFCKPLGGVNGKGGFAFKRQNGMFFRNGAPVQVDILFEQIRQAAAQFGSMIVQERLRLHPSVLPISPSGALSTARVVSCREEDGQVRLVASILKICAGDNETDNFARGLTGNLIAAIDPLTGCLSAAVGSASHEFPLLRTRTQHPDSGESIEGFVLPDWSILLDLVKIAHLEFSEFWTLGWDIALTDRGPVLVESNPVWATAFLQTATRRGLKHEFKRWETQLQDQGTGSIDRGVGTRVSRA